MAIAATLTTAAFGMSSPLSAATKPDERDYTRFRDHPMGSQIARNEGGSEPLSAQSSADDPTAGLQGIDVSRWQGNVDWQYWWDQGKRFAYVKATEGTYHTNAYFTQQYGGSAEVGMTRGAYHFAIPSDSTGAAQANFFVDNGGGWTRDGTTLPGVIDLEHNPYKNEDGLGNCYGLAKTDMLNWIAEFIDTYKQRTGRYPVIYTSTSWWAECVDSPAFAETSPLWIARYNSEVGTLPTGWTSWTIWQYSDNPIDQNKFNGTATELQRLADGPAPTAPTSVSAKGGVQRATVTWQEPRWAGVGGVTKYRITVSPGGKVIDYISPETRSKVVGGLASGVTYTFAVQAYSQDGAGGYARKRLIGTKATSALSATTVTYGTSVKFSGKAYRVDTGKGVSGWTVTLQNRTKGSTTWRSVSTITTSTYGSYSFTVQPWSSRDYRAVYLSGNSTYLGTTSPVRPVTVRQRVTGTFNDSSVRRGTTVTFAGAVSPSHAGQKIYLQRYTDGRWSTVAGSTLGSTSKFRFSITRWAPGTYYYRAYKPGHTDHAAGYGPSRKLTVT